MGCPHIAHPAVRVPVVLPPLRPRLDPDVALQHAQDALLLVVLPVLLDEVLIYLRVADAVKFCVMLVQRVRYACGPSYIEMMARCALK